MGKLATKMLQMFWLVQARQDMAQQGEWASERASKQASNVLYEGVWMASEV
jgi:hypothetical protein